MLSQPRIIFLGILLITSFSSGLLAQGSTFSLKNPNGAFNSLRKALARPDLSYTDCMKSLRTMNAAVRTANIGLLKDSMRPGSVMPDADPEQAPNNASSNLFQASMHLRDRLYDYYLRGEIQYEDLKEIWLAERLLRLADEEIQYFQKEILPYISKGRLPPKEQTARMLSRFSQAYYDNQIRINPKYEKDFYGPGGLPVGSSLSEEGIDFRSFAKGLRSGDVIVTRARQKSGVSPAISRIGNSVYEDSDVSHVFVVYKYTDAEGREQTKYIEAMIEDGVSIHDFDHFVQKVEKHRLARFGVLRFRDQEVAQRGAQRLFELVSRMKIAYDFKYRPLKDVLGSLDFSEGWEKLLEKLVQSNKPTELFCSAIAEFMIYLGSDGKIQVPAYPTQVQLKNDWYLEQFGTKRGPVSAPADFLRDPRFDQVAWVRDPIIAMAANQADAVLDVIYDYVDEKNYRFYPHWKGVALVSVLYPLRHIRPDDHPIWKLPIFRKLKTQFPQNATRSALGFMANLQNVYERLYNALWWYERSFIREHGRQLTPEERRKFVKAYIETEENRRFRWSDLRRRRLSNYFRPAD